MCALLGKNPVQRVQGEPPAVLCLQHCLDSPQGGAICA